MRLPALEKNILVYRALQMALFLFYAESLRRQIVESVGKVVRQGKELKGGKLVQAVFQRLVADRLISGAESEELQELLAHRNKIAHEVHLLTGDIELPGRNYRFGNYLRLRYDYAALTRIRKWHESFWERLREKYCLSISFDHLPFEAAEQAYRTELTRLRKRIDRQYLLRQRRIARMRTDAKRSSD